MNVITINSKKGKYYILEYHPRYLDDIIKTWQIVFQKEINRSFWLWKYQQNPAGFRTILCIDENGKVIVHYGAMCCNINFFGQSCLALQLTDIFTHPKYRWAIGGKTGLFVQTARTFWQTYLKNAPFGPELDLHSIKSKASFVWGLPGKRHARLGQKVIKYGVLPDAFYGELNKKSLKAISTLLWSVTKISTDEDPPSQLAELWQQKGGKSKTFCIRKDFEYLKWRFYEKPRNEKDIQYHLYLLKRPWKSEIKAWVVIGAFPNSSARIILDFFSLSTKDIKRLLIHIINENPNSRFKVWLSSNSLWISPLLDLGFMPKREPLGIIPSFQSFYKPFKGLKNSFEWRIGDSDLF